MALILEVGGLPAAWRGRLRALRQLNPAVARRARQSPGGAATLFLDTLPTIWAGEPIALLAQRTFEGRVPRPFRATTWLRRGTRPLYDALPPSVSQGVNCLGDGALFLSGEPKGFVDAVRLPFVGSTRLLLAACERLLSHLGISHPLPAEAEVRGRIANAGYAGLDLKPWDLEIHSLFALRRAAEVAEQTDSFLHVRYLHERKPLDIPICFYLQELQGFGSLRRAYPTGGGSAVTIEFACGYRYLVPLAYMLSWYPGWEEYEGRIIARTKIFGLSNEMLGLTLDRGPRFVTRTTTILETCEPTFDAFGGVDNEYREAVAAGHARFGGFRVYPEPMPPVHPRDGSSEWALRK